MYARTTFTQVRPDKLDEAIRIYHDSIVPAAKQQRGFKNLSLLTDRTSGKCITISMWETEAHLKASEDSGFYKQQLDKLSSCLSGAPTRDIYEVSEAVMAMQ
jgi:heme-degrading monooxygenase HmoA